MSRLSTLHGARLLVFGLVALLATSASALTLSYGNKQNAQIQYNNIQETATNPDPPLFQRDGANGFSDNIFLGATGTTLVFDLDPDFFAESTSASGANTDSRLSLDIVLPNTLANANLRIGSVRIVESGDYNLSLDGAAKVTGTLIYQVTDLDFVTNLSIPAQTINMAFTPPGSGGNGHWISPADGDDDWEGVLNANVAALTTRATAIRIFEFDNVLEAFSFDGGTNAIHKKAFSIEVTLIPEPGTAALMALGLVGLGIRRRRA